MLSTVVTLLGSRLGRYILTAGTSILAVAVLLLRVFAQGRKYEQAKVTQQQLKELKNAAEAGEKVSKLSRVDRARYVNKWLRNDD